MACERIVHRWFGVVCLMLAVVVPGGRAFGQAWDGVWTGSMSCGSNSQMQPPFSRPLRVTISSNIGSVTAPRSPRDNFNVSGRISSDGSARFVGNITGGRSGVDTWPIHFSGLFYGENFRGVGSEGAGSWWRQCSVELHVSEPATVSQAYQQRLFARNSQPSDRAHQEPNRGLIGEQSRQPRERDDQNRAEERDRILEAQRHLRRLQLYQGAIDGQFGSNTRRALEEFQRGRGKPPTGVLTAELVEDLRRTTSPVPLTNEARTRIEVETRQRQEVAAAQARADAEVRQRQEAAAAQARAEAEARQRQEAAAAQARAEAEVRQRQEAAAAQARAEAEARQRQEAAAAQARAEAEARQRQEAAAVQARAEAEARQRQEAAAAQARAEAEVRQGQESANARARAEAELRARLEVEVRARLEAEIRERNEAEARQRREAERASQREAIVRMTGRRVALVIGNGDYKHGVPLRNPVNDARRMAQLLEELGFEVILGLDLDRREMERNVRAFGERLDGARLGLLFYAGHGMQVGGENYLLPIDAKLERERDLPFETLPLAQLLRTMESSAAANLVFLDACRDNPLARSLARSLGTRSTMVGQGLAQIQSGLGTLVAYATQPGNVALDGSGANSPFTDALAQHLAAPGLDVALAMRRVREAVVTSTSGRQVPWDHSSLTGEVVLRPNLPSTSARVPGTGTQQNATSGVGAAQFDREALFWQSALASGRRADFEAYLLAFPNGMFAPLARSRLAQ